MGYMIVFLELSYELISLCLFFLTYQFVFPGFVLILCLFTELLLLYVWNCNSGGNFLLILNFVVLF